MIASLLLALSLSQSAALPEAVRGALEAQLPLWSEATGTPASATRESEERIAVERTEGSEIHVVLIARKLKATVRREGERTWLTEVTWCGEGTDRCEDLWNRRDEEWRSDRATANHTGYAVYRDSLRLESVPFNAPVPPLAFGKKTWDRALCGQGLCFAAATRDSSVAAVALRPDGSILWWDASSARGAESNPESSRLFRLLSTKGSPVPAH